ncbi:MAG TPA: tryptophan--tRNA ligase [Candidatus Moranbacteria bacterium]|nr:tryptophan--tRNA ligase [Candidatus Moranbacteria bacterium]HRY28232.1 tryptophan--tRNA ligase [Candidatus Moranbacteria bacterium]HSA08045.1 tryptophan--tRNA ligase [Candidatus Moranbacteria bacterium]
MAKRIFSGIKPSGSLTIGNYIGAIRNWLDFQDEYEAVFCVVDMHAITVPQDPKTLNKRTIEIAKIYLASGIDPKKSAIFVQSQVAEHAELAWILNTVARVSDLDKMTQFKDKSQKNGRESAGVGLYDYPVLMAADILLYDAEKVPVGEDQVQHVELARTLAKRFNNNFGETFVIPEPFVKKSGMRIRGLDDPTKKMDKSSSSEYNYIALLDDAESVRRKIKKAVTDSGSEIIYSEEKPALKNLINIHSFFSEKSPKDIEKMYAGKGYGEFKNDLAEIVVSFLKDFQQKYNSYSDEEVIKILKEGAEKARLIAEKKMQEVKKKVGFII